jgi:diguanylate cyclase
MILCHAARTLLLELLQKTMIEFLCTLAGTVMGMGLGAILAQQFRVNTSASNKLEMEQLRHLISHMRSIATGMAAGVDMHQGRIEMVNNSLSSMDADNPAMLERAINALLQANKLMQEELSDAQNRIAKQAQALEQVTAQARTDALTGVANRLAFNEAVEDAVECFQSEGRTTTLALLDIDFFKKINDTYGHAVGDQVLTKVASVLQEKLLGRGLVARYGGEEFGILFAGCPAAWMVRIMEETRKSIENVVIVTEQGNVRVTCSAGMADFLADDTPESLLERADQGLYLSKQNGRNRGHWNSHGKWLPMENQSLEMLWHPLDASEAVALDMRPTAKKGDAELKSKSISASEPSETEKDVVATTAEVLDLAQRATGSNEPESSALRPARRGNSDRPQLLQTVMDHEKFTECLSQALNSIPDSSEPVSVLKVRIANRKELFKKYGDDGMSMCEDSLLQSIRCSLRGVDKVGQTENGDYEVLMVGPVLEAVCYRAARIQVGMNSANDTLALTEMRIQMATTLVTTVEETATIFARIEEALAYETDPAAPCVVVHDGTEIRIESHPLMGL